MSLRPAGQRLHPAVEPVPVAAECRDCGSNVRETRITSNYAERGLHSIRLHGVRAFVCLACGKTDLLIDHRPVLHREIAGRLVRKSTALAPEEVRFLREHLRCSNQKLAHCLGVTPATASRWASPRAQVPIAATADRLLRLIVALRDGHDCQPLALLRQISRTAVSRPERMQLWAVEEGWADVPPG